MRNNLNQIQQLEFETNRQKAIFCPCGKDNKDGKFSPHKGYYDKGYCFSCGKYFAPGATIKETDNNSKKQKVQVKKSGPPSIIDTAFFKNTLGSYEYNNLVIFLKELVGVNKTEEAVSKYFIGTSRYWPNATIFWQIAKDNNIAKIRSGKIIQYNIVPSYTSCIGKDCKRNKKNNIPVKWVHRLFPDREYNLVQCFFGEHLIKKDFSIPIAICESEKTAIIASIYLPQFTWLAAGSLSNLTRAKYDVLKGRKIILFPDLNGFDLWKKKVTELSSIATVRISDLLEKKASIEDRKQGLDLADYLIRFDYKTFNKNIKHSL